MIKITCTSCQRPLSLDETKLPMREVSFPCPVCKAKLTVDRTRLEGTEAMAADRIPSTAPAALEQHEDHQNEFGAKALIVGADHPALRQAAKLIGFLPVYMPTAEKAREYLNLELPQVVLLHPAQLTPPPLESMQPIVSLLPADRRKAFYILVAENLRTLDGNAAFLYGVNLVVASKDVAQLPQIYRDAHAYHERLYASMNAVLRSLSA